MEIDKVIADLSQALDIEKGFIGTSTQKLAPVIHVAQLLHEENPDEMAAHYLYTLTLKWGMQFASAERELILLKEKHCAIPEVKNLIEYGLMNWHDGFQYPEWNEKSISFTRQYSDRLKSLLLMDFRDGIHRRACIAIRAQRNWFGVLPFPSNIIGSFEILWVDNDIAPAVGLYPMLNDKPEESVINETYLFPSVPEYHQTLKTFIEQDHTYFIMFDEDDNLLMNRKIIYNDVMRKKLADISKKMEGMNETKNFDQTSMMSALREIQSKVDYRIFTFVDYNALAPEADDAINYYDLSAVIDKLIGEFDLDSLGCERLLNENEEVAHIADKLFGKHWKKTPVFSQAYELFKGKDYIGVAEILKDHCTENSETPEFWYLLAAAYLLSSNVKAALPAFKKADLLNCKPASTLLLKAGLADDAEPYLEQALRYLKKSKHRESLSYFQKYMELRNDDMTVKYLFGLVTMMAGHNSLGMMYVMEAASQGCSLALVFVGKRSSGMAWEKYNAGISFMEKGRDLEALEAFKEYLKIDRENSDVMIHVAGLYQKMGDSKSAGEYLVQAATLGNDKAVEMLNMPTEV